METTMALQLCNQSNISDVSSEDCSTAPVAGATIVSPVIMFILGVVGNVVAICTIQISRKTARTSKFYILISGLAWTDLLGIVLTTPSVISAYINGRKWVGGEAHCFYQGFAMTCAGLSTTLIICAISVERFLALKCVFFYSSRCSHGTTRCIIAGLWITVIWFGLLPLFGFGRYEVQYPDTWCFLDFHSRDGVINTYAYIYASVNLILVAIMITCNGYVVYTLYTLRKRKEFQVEDGKRDSLLASQHTEWTTTGLRTVRKKNSAVDIQMIVLMCAISSTFVICWAPLMVQIIVTIATKQPNYLMDLAAIRLASLNQLLDPWLYILLRKSIFLKVRGSVIKLWKKICCCHMKNANEQEEMVNILAVEMKQDSLNNVNVIDNINELQNMNQVNTDIDKNIPDVSNVNPSTSNSVSTLPDVIYTGQCNVNVNTCNGCVNRNNSDIDVESDNNIKTETFKHGNNQQQYVCRFDFGNDEQHADVGSVYIKVLFLNDECHKSNGNTQTCPRLQVTRAMSCLAGIASTEMSLNKDNYVAMELTPYQLSPCTHRPGLAVALSTSEANTLSCGADNRIRWAFFAYAVNAVISNTTSF